MCPAKIVKPEFDISLDQNASIDPIFHSESVAVIKEVSQQVGELAEPSIFEASTDHSRKAAALESLFGVLSASSNEQVSFESMLTKIITALVDHIPCEAASFAEIDFTADEIFFRAATGRVAEKLREFRIPKTQGLVGFACENQQILSVANADESAMHLKTVSNALGFDVNNVLVAPVIIRGQTFGAIELINRRGIPQFTESDKDLLGAVIQVASLAIETRLLIVYYQKQLAAVALKEAA